MTRDSTTHALWPFFDLRIRSHNLELRVPRGADLDRLAVLVLDGVHDPAVQPFGNAWTDRPPLERQRAVYQWQWKLRSEWSRDLWTLSFAIVRGDTVIGLQDLKADRFALRREVSTGSWLGREHQGQGLGKEMRAAVLAFAFSTLGAEYATTCAFADNAASNGVSGTLGYSPDGEEIQVVRGQPALLQRYRMTRAQWFARERPPIDVTGAADCLAMLGADAESATP